ncbi:hypothetical protein JCM5350_006641 [Sporobolomyces pararoseus]
MSHPVESYVQLPKLLRDLPVQYFSITPSSGPAAPQVTLLGAFALFLHAYGAPFVPSAHSAPTESTPPAGVQLILLSLFFRAHAADLIVDVNCISKAIPSVGRLYKLPQEQRPRHYEIVTGAYLILDLIHTHLEPDIRHNTTFKDHHATLTLLLHSLVQLAPDRPSLDLPVQQNRNVNIPQSRDIKLIPLHVLTIQDISSHPQFPIWKTTLEKFFEISCSTLVALW